MATPEKKGEPDVPERGPTGLPEDASTVSQWIMNNVNLLHARLTETENRLSDRLTGMENRIFALEKTIKLATGGLIVLGMVWMVVQFLLSQYDITFTSKK